MSSDDSDDDCYGPQLPPHLANPVKIIGPQLPPSITKSDLEAALAQPTPKEILPIESKEDSDEDDDIGPYPPDDPRSLRVPKANLRGSNTSAPLKREEWMLIAPKNKTIAEVVGMEPRSRKFLARTPDEIEKPEDEEEEEPDFMETAKAELVARCERERDEEMNQMLEKTVGAKGKESLLSIHRKRKKEAPTGPKERRPFDRDEDLKVGGLSKEDQEKFIKKTGELGNRFKGGKKKFL